MIIGPARANQEHRVEYDAEDHSLPGEGVIISKTAFSTMSESDFQNVPTYGGQDTALDSPRRVTLSSSTGCVDISTKDNIQGKRLVAAVSVDSPYQAKHITASAVGDGIKVCLVEPLSSSDGSAASIDVVLQTK